MVEPSLEQLTRFLRSVLGPDVDVVSTGDMAGPGSQSIKEFGYGRPLLVRYTQGGVERGVVLSVMKGDKYGHQFWWDRAAALMFQYDAAPRMERHVPVLALGYFDRQGRLVNVERPAEFFLVTHEAPGHDYYLDLERASRDGLIPADLDLARELARWLARVHAAKKDDPPLYLRGVRQTIGSSECIFGIVDGYPYPYSHFPPARFKDLEHRLIDWRWRLHDFTHRLCAVHGDFHPFNLLVEEGGSFTVLDRSRGEWGEPADDVASMSLNFLLFGLLAGYRATGRALVVEPMRVLFHAFWEEYLARTGDQDMGLVIAPYYAYRILVVDSPEWYPNHPLEVRQTLFRFMERVLAAERFDHRDVDALLD